MKRKKSWFSKSGITFLLVLVLLLLGCRHQPVDTEKAKYIDLGEVYNENLDQDSMLDVAFNKQELLQKRENFEKGLYDDGTLEAVVPDVETAYYVALYILTADMGAERVSQMPPFRISLWDNLVWHAGTRKEVNGISIEVFVNRIDGRIRIMSEKL